MMCNGYIHIIPHEEVVSHGECDTCGKKIILPEENYIDFVKKYGKMWACDERVISKFDVHFAVKEYKQLRLHALKLKEQGKLFGKFNDLVFSDTIKDIQAMIYKKGYKDIVRGYKMRFIIKIGEHKEILIYEYI